MGSPQFLFQIQSPPSLGEASSAVDEAYINGVYAGLNLLTSLPFNPAAGGRNSVPTPASSLPNLLSIERSESGRRRARREKSVTEKARRLQKLLPRDKKMDTATVLEETYKYIKFLEAQVSVLRSMPVEHVGSAAAEVGGELGMLNRQQLLEVLVNSPAAQAALYSKGCCVYSAEQVDLVKKRVNPYDSNPNANPLFYAW